MCEYFVSVVAKGGAIYAFCIHEYIAPNYIYANIKQPKTSKYPPFKHYALRIQHYALK